MNRSAGVMRFWGGQFNPGTRLSLPLSRLPIAQRNSRMNLKFNVSEKDVLAFSERYYRSSPSHNRVRESTRIMLPLMLTPVMLLFIYNFGFSPLPSVIFLVAMAGWYVLYPRRFDKRVRKYMEKQMKESSYSNMFGAYELSFDDEHLMSTGPTGESKYKWNAVNRAELSDEYLFVFLSGPQGFTIPINQIGFDVAHQACNVINDNVKNA